MVDWWSCHAKITPPLKLVRPDRFWQKNLPKPVPPDHFCCQNWSGRTNFGCQKWSPLAKISPPWGPILAKITCTTGFGKTDHIVTIDISRNTDLKYRSHVYLPKSVPPCMHAQSGTLSVFPVPRTWLHECSYSITS